MRSVEGKLIPVALANGMDESGGQRSTQAVALYRAENARVRSAGTIQKRGGTLTIAGTTNVSTADGHCLVNGGGSTRPTEHPAFIADLNGQQIAGTSAGDAFAYNGAHWDYRGSFSTVLPTNSRTAFTGGDVFNDISDNPSGIGALSDGSLITAVILPGDGFVRMQWIDQNGHTIYEASDIYTPTTKAKAYVVTGGTSAVVLWTDGATVRYRAFTLTQGNVTAVSGKLVDLYDANSSWDASSYDSLHFYLVYQSAAATATIAKVTGTTVSGSTTFAATNPYLSIWADPTNATLWIGVFDDPGSACDQAYVIADTTPSITVAKTSTGITGSGSTGNASPPLFGPCYSGTTPTYAMCLLSVTVASQRTAYAFIVTPTGTIVGGDPTRCGIPHMLPMSKPDALQRAWCMISPYEVTYHRMPVSQAFLLRFEDACGTHLATADFVVSAVIEASTPQFIMPNFYAIGGTGYNRNTNAIATYDGGYATILPIVVQSETESIGTTRQFTQPQVFSYSSAIHRSVVQIGSSLAVPGQPVELEPGNSPYKDASVGSVEFGFAYPPQIVSASTSGAGNVDVGSHAYKAVATWQDNLGRLHQSEPSAPVTVSVTTASQCSIQVFWPALGQRPPPGTEDTIRIVLYRTVADGENYQALPLNITPGAGSITVTDNIADSALESNGFIYTDGNVLPNVLAPFCRQLVPAEERLWCVGLWDPSLLEASKIKVPGEPYNFTGHPSHQVVLPEDCTGAAYIDGQLVVFADNAVYLVGGDGPNDQGAGTFLPPRLLTRATGCIDYRSIVVIDDGVLFQSRNGLMLLPRGFGPPQYVGAQVRDTLRNYPTILSACTTTTADYTCARFLVAADGAAYSNRVLTFDMVRDQWFCDTYLTDGNGYHGFAEIGDWGSSGVALFRYDLTSALSPIWYEDETVFTDAGGADAGNDTAYSLTLQTTWIYPFGVGGWGFANKCIIAMAHEFAGSINTDNATVSVTIETDQPGTSEAKSWTVAGTSSLDASYRGFDIASRKCTSVRGTIVASQGTRGPKFLGLTIEVGPDGSESGIRMLTDSER